MAIAVQASGVRQSTCCPEDGVDLDVVVTLPDGREVRGEVTLLPAEDGRPRYESWGHAENWVSGSLLSELRATADGDHTALREMLSTLASEASATAGRVEPI